MSGNNSYTKSMNGIVSFDTGGTSIEGDEITTGEINCTTLNASSDVNTTTTYTNFIENNTSSSITITGDTTFNNDIYVSNLFPSPGITPEINLNGVVRVASTIYADFIAPNTNTEISISGDAKFNADVYVNNIYPKTGTEIILKNNTSVNGALTSTSFKTPTIEGTDTNSITKQLKIGQDNDYTTSINIGRAAQTILGTVYPAIPPRTTFYAVGNDDICNKLYVDTVTGGTSILASTNTWTGTSNTFNNKIVVSNITVDTNTLTASPTTNAIDLFKTTTGDISIGSSGRVNIINDFSFSNTVMSGTSTNGQYNIMSDVTTGIVRFGHSITTGIIAFGQAMTTGTVNFVSPVSGTSSATMNIGNSMSSSGTVNICSSSSAAGNVNIGYSGTVKLCNSINVTSNSIASGAVGDTINLFNNITTGSVNMCKIKFQENRIETALSSNNFNLLENITTGNIFFAGYITTGSLNIATASSASSTINIGNFGNINIGTFITSNIIKLGGAFRSTGSVLIWDNISITNDSIFSRGINDTINLFNNITTGTLNLASGLTTGLLQIGGGKIKFGNQQISGYTEYNSISANFIIPATVNKEYFVVITGGSPITLTIPASTAIIGQIINIRNRSSTTTHNVTTFPSTTIGIYPDIAGSARFQPAWTMPASTAQRLYFDGSNWVGF
jgi:hypothetical protein